MFNYFNGVWAVVAIMLSTLYGVVFAKLVPPNENSWVTVATWVTCWILMFGLPWFIGYKTKK